jgi:dihydroneopterin triphosphate diphosphatase
VVDVYPYRLGAAGAEWLVLRRASDVRYAGSWRMVGGKIVPGETAWQAALRELREETGREALMAWTLPAVNVFYEWESDRIERAPAFAARIEGDPILDREHDRFEWLRADAAAGRLAWPEQQRLLRLADDLLQRDGIAAEWQLPV